MRKIYTYPCHFLISSSHTGKLLSTFLMQISGPINQLIIQRWLHGWLFSRFNEIPACDRRTDGQTERIHQHRYALLCYAGTREKATFELIAFCANARYQVTLLPVTNVVNNLTICSVYDTVPRVLSSTGTHLGRGTLICGECADCLFLVLARSPAVAEGPREHAVSWNLIKCCTNVPRIALEKACNRRMTFKVI